MVDDSENERDPENERFDRNPSTGNEGPSTGNEGPSSSNNVWQLYTESGHPEDVYTFTFASDFWSVYNIIAFLTTAIQITILVLFFQTQVKGVSFGPSVSGDPFSGSSYSGNPFSIPLRVPTEVNIAQALAVIVTIIDNMDELASVVNIYDMPVFKDYNKYFGKFKHLISMSLRLIVTMGVLAVSFLIIIQSFDVLELFLNFVAITFVGRFDNIVYTLIGKGVMGESLKKEVDKIGKRECKIKSKSSTCLSSFVGRGFALAVLLALVGLLVWAKYYQYSNHFQILHCQKFQLNIQENTEFKFFQNVLPERNMSNNNGVNYTSSWAKYKILDYRNFNGLYTSLDEQNEMKLLTRNRPTYYQEGNSTDNPLAPFGKISYCRSSGRWVFNIPGITKGNNEDKEGCDWLMRSAETGSYTLDEVPMTGWNIWSGEHTGLVQLIDDGSFLSCAHCGDTTDCNYHGICEHNYGKYKEKKCVCDTPWRGVKCDICSACDRLRVKADDWEVNLEIADMVVHDRPVYTSGSGGLIYVLLYTGARFVVGALDGVEGNGQGLCWLGLYTESECAEKLCCQYVEGECMSATEDVCLPTPPTCLETGLAATCCDDDDSCTDGNDDWCCADSFYCSNNSQEYAEYFGGILCPLSATSLTEQTATLSRFLKNYHAPWEYDGFTILGQSEFTTLGRPITGTKWFDVNYEAPTYTIDCAKPGTCSY